MSKCGLLCVMVQISSLHELVFIYVQKSLNKRKANEK